MNDKIIINTISKIHFIIISFLSFIFLTLSIIFILLQNGLYIENISIPHFKMKQLYIKWNEKIYISISEVTIINEIQNNSPSLDYKKINNLFKQLYLFNNWFEEITINKIAVNNISASFRYTHGNEGFLVASSPDFLLRSSLLFESNLFNMKIDALHDFKRKIFINGNLILNVDNREITSSINININDELSLNVLANTNADRLSYRINSLHDIKSIQHTIDLFQLDKRVRYWIIDAVSMSELSLNNVHGWVDYNDLGNAYKNIYAQATLNKLKYTYDSELDSIHSKKTEIEFKNGVLYIYPKEAYSYNFFLDKSWLKIDFTKKEELLTLHLLFKGMLNKDIKSVLNRYKIEIPFLQNSGIVNTNLKIEVNLRTIEVAAVGDFFTKKANFNYLGLDIDIFDTYVSLRNYDVLINDMLAKYKNIATAKVDVKLDTKNGKGHINFKVEDIKIKDIDLSLENKPLKITYNIFPAQDSINIEFSTWKFKENTLNIAQLAIPFNLSTLEAIIPKTFIEIPNLASAYVAGEVLLKPYKADLNIDVLNFAYKNLKLAQASTPIQFKYDQKTSISSPNEIKFYFNNLESILKNTLINIEKDVFKIKHSALEIDTFLKTNLSGTYNYKNSNGALTLKDLELTDSTLGEIFYNKEDITFNIKKDSNTTTIYTEEFGIDYIFSNIEWTLKLNSMSSLFEKSKLLQKYYLKDGNLTLSKNTKEENINLLAHLHYPYKILVADNEPLDTYTIKGKVNDISKDISININNSINVEINEEIKITAKETGININELLHLLNDLNSTSNNSTAKNIILKSKDCYLYIDKNRHIISDKIDLQYLNNVLSAQLLYKDGSAFFNLKNNKFHIYGENFNDAFMDNFFALSKFKNGSLTFSMEGTAKEYNGTFHIKDTTILDYKILNNILAFVNTIPSLVTFSLPGYSKNGLAVASAYINFNAKDDVLNITDVYLDSREIDILGRGTASFKRNEIDLQLNLKTDLGSSLSKIPVVGYIMLDGDSISSSLRIKGPLDNPEVTTLIAQDIILAPLNIIKRTFLLPYHLITGEK
ncbi:AsmA-like C-terminal domain-containing protein [bacterium]|nr:AsmA-like C-terminal domain-containing protein [bacterium]MBU1994289.1 AsmA-like C-terminal domain-containing protein [bacterium]